MEWLKKILYAWNKKQYVVSITCNISVYTESGYEFINMSAKTKELSKVYVFDDDKYNYYQNKRELLKDEKLISFCSQQSKKILSNLRKDIKTIEMKQGYFISGKHLVKTTWDIDSIEYQVFSYEEYKDYKKLYTE